MVLELLKVTGNTYVNKTGVRSVSLDPPFSRKKTGAERIQS